ncbi:hypothetical protein DS2_13694 [Catenovulum agarivorans DS-2]|uniref:Glycoside hydrolase family 42 n=2 Tax=Catenovulum agarivorans TaxID=1172192 RepID=W7QMS4_9ALTE|nr:hypothetical protein DS2_13694 [Catenovulum agarivorans DS-2]
MGILLPSITLLTTACTHQYTNTESSQAVSDNKYEQQALAKLATLKNKMAVAKDKNIDVTREETIVWFSEQFLKFANWDEANLDAIEAAFGYERYYKPRKKGLALALPDYERRKVIEILDKGIQTLDLELEGKIKRRPVRKVDWQNTKAADNMFLSQGKPIFPYDYFSKTVGQPLTNTDIYNDHLGAIYHGGENLYPVDHDRAINSFLVKQDGTFDQELLKELTSIPDTNIGFLLYWLMGIPEWVEQQEPEVRKGRSLFTGFDVDNPLARELWAKIIRKTAELTKGKKVTELGYILANEPHWFAEKGYPMQKYKEMNEISSYTLTKFRNWLRDKYQGNITKLNKNWQSNFDDFDNITIEIPIDPILIGQPKWYDWSRYNMDRGTEWFTFMQNELHAVNPQADTHIKIMPRMFLDNNRSGGIDTEALTELTTMIGHDAKSFGSPPIRPHLSAKWNEKYAYYWSAVTMFHDFLESVAPNKININSESHFLSSGAWRDMDPRTSYVRSVYWLATLHGMDANMGWFWARDPDGSPEDRLEGELSFFDPGLAGAFAGSNNMQPHVSNEVTQVMYDLNSFSEEIISLREQVRPIRIFYSETSAINSKDYMTKAKKLYEKLFFEGLPLGYATKNIIEKQDNSKWDLIIVDNNHFVTDDEFNALQNYLSNGGVIVLTSAENLAYNEYGEKRPQQLQANNGKLIVLPNQTSLDEIKHVALTHVQKTNQPKLKVKEDNGQPYKTTAWRVVEQNNGCYLLNLLNFGHQQAHLQIYTDANEPISMVDLMTANKVDSQLNLQSEGVLLLQVNVNNSATCPSNN